MTKKINLQGFVVNQSVTNTKKGTVANHIVLKTMSKKIVHATYYSAQPLALKKGDIFKMSGYFAPKGFFIASEPEAKTVVA